MGRCTDKLLQQAYYVYNSHPNKYRVKMINCDIE